MSRGSGMGLGLSFGVGSSVIVERGPATSVPFPERGGALMAGPARGRWQGRGST